MAPLQAAAGALPEAEVVEVPQPVAALVSQVGCLSGHRLLSQEALQSQGQVPRPQQGLEWRLSPLPPGWCCS